MPVETCLKSLPLILTLTKAIASLAIWEDFIIAFMLVPQQTLIPLIITSSLSYWRLGNNFMVQQCLTDITEINLGLHYSREFCEADVVLHCFPRRVMIVYLAEKLKDRLILGALKLLTK